MNGRKQTICLVVWAACLMAIGGLTASAEKAAPAAAAKPEGKKAEAAGSAASAKLSDTQIQQLAKSTGLTSTSVRAAIAYMRKYKPIQARQIAKMAQENNAQMRASVREASAYERQLASLKKSDPTRYSRQERTLAFGAQAELLAERYSQSSEDQKPHVEVELLKVLSNLFDLRVEEERDQLQQLRRKADQMQERVEARVKNKDRIVDRQLTSRLGIDEILVW